MSSEEREPTREELLAMAYADGELPPAERAQFEGLLTERGDLRAEVARLQRLNVLARDAAGPEPIDLEWAALRRDPAYRASLGLGLALFVGGLGLLVAGGLWMLWTGTLALAVKLAVSALVAGFVLLLAAYLRARLRTRAYDPYTEIER